MYRKVFLSLISFSLAIIPFFWLKPGEMDLGGDSSRLYFYDPINYLTSFPLYFIVPNGIGTETAGYYLIPFVFLLSIFKQVLGSSYLLITLFNSASLVIAFLSVFGIVKTMLTQDYHLRRQDEAIYFAGIIAGLFYVLSPVLTYIGWEMALFNHNQVFLNPLMFFLILQFLLKRNILYGLFALLLTFFFAPNFSPSPYLFSFFIFAFIYLAMYVCLVKRITLPKKQLFITGILFIFISLFHLYPFISAVFSKGNVLNDSAFTDWGKFDRGLGYFSIITESTKVANNIFSLVQGNVTTTPLFFLFCIFPLILVYGLLAYAQRQEKKEEKSPNFLLLSLFFLGTLFFASANITAVGLEVYKLLFNIPGFSMFRNYYGQFSHVFIFFYALVIGYALFNIFISKTFVSRFSKQLVFTFLLLFIVINAIPFINGTRVRVIANKSTANEIPLQIQMDPHYEQLLTEVRKDKSDGKFISFPFDDFGYQLLAGKNGGIYRGPPIISYLTGRSEFTGFAGLVMFKDLFVNAVRDKDYDTVNTILSLLNVRYIFYNSDSFIYPDYKENETGWPFADIKVYMPGDQELYQKFIQSLGVSKVSDIGENYHVYKLADKNFLPHIYVAKQNIYSNSKSLGDMLKLVSFTPADKRVALFLQEDPSDTKKQNDVSFFYAKKSEELWTPAIKHEIPVILSPISQEFYTLIHPLMILGDKRKYENPELKQDKIFELGLYKSEEIIEQILQKVLLFSKEKGQQDKVLIIDSLNALLREYKPAVNNTINYLDNKKENFYGVTNSKLRLRNILLVHQNKIETTLLENTTLTKQQRDSLLDVTDTVFSNFSQVLGLDSTGQTEIVYSVPLLKGNYEVFIDKNIIEKKAQQKTFVAIDSATLSILSPTFQKNWLSFSDVTFEGEKVYKATVTLPYTLSFATNSLPGSENAKDNSGESYLIKYDLVVEYLKWLVSQYVEWKPNITYYISFDYTAINSTTLQSSSWKPYKVVVEFNENNEAILTFIAPAPAIPASIDQFNTITDIAVKNLSVVPFEYPVVILKKKQEIQNNNSTIPNITFTKINPTKYEVKVSGAKDPYTLVLLDSYSTNWKLFLPQVGKIDTFTHGLGIFGKNVLRLFMKQPEQKQITTSFYNGEIVQGENRNSFLDPNTFETWGVLPIADNKHKLVNGYANAWHIEPKDTEGKTDYTIIVELSSQRTLYPLLFLSILSVSGVLIWVLVILYRIYMRRKTISSY